MQYYVQNVRYVYLMENYIYRIIVDRWKWDVTNWSLLKPKTIVDSSYYEGDNDNNFNLLVPAYFKPSGCFLPLLVLIFCLKPILSKTYFVILPTLHVKSMKYPLCLITKQICPLFYLRYRSNTYLHFTKESLTTKEITF